MSNIYDIIVVGAGPAGLSVAIEAGKRDLNCLIIDKGSIVNTIRRYPTYAVFFSTADLLELADIPFPAINKQPTRQEALRYYTRLAQHFSVRHSLYNTVHSIEKNDSVFEVSTDKGVFKSHNVVMAIGYFEQFNMLNVPGENLPHVKHYYTEAFSYVGRKVVVIGGSNSAGEAILDLWRHGAEVALVHRGAQLKEKMKYWIRPDLQNRIAEGSIPAYFNSVVREIREDSILIENGGEVTEIKADHVLALTGFHPDAEFLGQAGVFYDEETLIPDFNEQTLESNVKGLYLAGTVLTGKFTSKIFIENSRHHGKLIVDAIMMARR